MSVFSFRVGTALDSPGTKRDYNRRLFEEVAPRYDRITRLLSFWRDRAWKTELVARLPAVAHPRCLDVACGTGDLTHLLLARYPEAEVVGLDLSEAMLAQAQARLCGARARVAAGDMSALPVRDAVVDILTGGYALRNAPDLGAFVAEVERVLKPGGVAAFLDFSRPDSVWRAHAAGALLRLWGGLWGLALHRDPHVYGYIAASLARFPTRSALARCFQDRGFGVRARALRFFGMIEITLIEKAGAPRRTSAATA